MGTPNWSMLKSTCGNHPPYFWTWWCEALFLFQLVKGLLFQMPLQRLTVRYSQQQNKYNTKLLSPSSTHKTKNKASSTNQLKHHRITSCCNAFHIFKKEAITSAQHILLSQNFTLLQNLIAQNWMSWEASWTVTNNSVITPIMLQLCFPLHWAEHQCNSPIDKLLILARTKSLQALHIVHSLEDLNYSIINVGVTLVLYVKMTYFVWQISWTMFYPFSNQAQSASNYDIYICNMLFAMKRQ